MILSVGFDALRTGKLQAASFSGESRSNLARRLRYHGFVAAEVRLSSQPKDSKHQPLIDTVIHRVLEDDAEFRRLCAAPNRRSGQADYLFAAGDQPHEAEEIFQK